MDEGIFQFFSCRNEYSAGDPFEKRWLFRIIFPSEIDIQADKEKFKIYDSFKSEFKPQKIIAWRKFTDHNDWDENVEAHYFDKLGGYPRWIHNESYPNCPKCKKVMRFLYQFSYSLPELATGHIFQCKTHRDNLTFSWDVDC